MNYIEKINDFKTVFNDFINPENDLRKIAIIDALFDNVRIYYEEYKDICHSIPERLEPYMYHVLQPVDGKYDLLDFLLNRAISNLEKIIINDTAGNSYSNHFELSIDKNRYNKLSDKKGDEVVRAHFKKSFYHETLHVLHAKIRPNGDKICSKSKDKLIYFYEKLSSKYHNIIDMQKIINASCGGPDTYLTKPFYLRKHSSGAEALTECAVESEAVINSGLINLGDVGPVPCGKGFCKFVHNYENGYARYQMFLMQLKSLVPKDQYFLSLFFHESSALSHFVSEYEDIIKKMAALYGFNEDQLLPFLYGIFGEANTNMFYGSEETDIDETLHELFIEIYQAKLSNIKDLSNEELLKFKKVLTISYNESPFEIVNNTHTLKETEYRQEYLELIEMLERELDKRFGQAEVNDIKR